MINTENIAYCVTRLHCFKADKSVSAGTGFFFGIHEGKETLLPILVTNKHVIKDSVEFQFKLTLMDGSGNPILKDYPTIRIPTKGYWVDHPDPKIDLCATTFGNILKHFETELKSKIRWSRIMPDNIPSKDIAMSFSELEDVVMVGYPIGISDEFNNRPIFRKGVTATKPGLSYNGKREFLIDIAAFPGSSGSPVFLYKEGFNVVNSAGDRLAGRDDKFYFVGILWGGHEHLATGKIESKPIPTALDSVYRSNIPANLGLVIPSEVLLEFETVFQKPN
ncbi:S1 family peptidase [Brumimicrobium aurantiacum]|uniref:Serine protease n=1 Tax=Brumimicrobium aurantiacum TaxID=1737063 RepID=A0A3E1F1G4_9FLAO|nr:serine protease [Brumimicrobium aurantiacum]RFC55658.1 serine protease [Brumimicrobium aurantiacum]